MDAGLTALAVARLSRFVTTDWLGEWTIVRPVKAWARKHEDQAIARACTDHAWVCRDGVPDFSTGTADHAECGPMNDYNENDPYTWQAKLATALDCPFCSGFWLGALMLGGLAVTRSGPLKPLGGALRGVRAALALNYVTGHISSRIDA